MKGATSNLGLPCVAVSVHDFLEMTAKWGYELPRHMGMSKEAHRLAARFTLEALLHGLAADLGGFRIVVDLEKDWQPIWPRPRPHWKSETLVIDATGICELDGFIETVTKNHACRKGLWWHEASLARLVSDLESTKVWHLIASTAVSNTLQSLHCQLVWDLGCALQRHLLGLAKEKGKSKSLFRFAAEGFSDISLDASHTMDRKLVEYVEVGKAALQRLNLRSISLCTDKASVGGLGSGLQNTIFTLGSSGKAILAVPQVLFSPWTSLNQPAVGGGLLRVM